MQKRRSVAPAQLDRYGADQKPSAVDPYSTAAGTAQTQPGRPSTQQQSRHQQPLPQHPAAANADSKFGQPKADMAAQPPPRSNGAQPGSSARRDISGRHPGQRERREQRIGDFIIKQTLGKGTFSKVCMAEHRTTKQNFALKFIKPKSPQGGSTDKHNIRVEREIKLLSLLYHPNIVRLYDVVQTPKFTMIVMEHNSGGELLHSIRKRGRLHENEARGFFRQIVSAMDYTHRNCIIHRDLKLENVMLDHENRIRIIDFGFANTFEWDKQLDTFCGSPFYAAPEMVNGIKYTGPEVDIWSMGVILFFMLCGRTPFEGENLKEIYDKISRGRFTMPPFLSSEAQHLLQQMLTVSPKLRISMKGIVEHPWTNKDCDQPIENHLPARPTVVLQPNDQSLQKMRVYKYEVDAVASALAHSDMALTPMVCIYHLVEESRRRKASRNARRSQATHMGLSGSDPSAFDVGPASTTPQALASAAASPASGASHEGTRPVSRNRYSYAPGYSNGDNYSPTSKAVNPLPAGDVHHKPSSSVSHPHGGNHLQAPQPHYMVHKDSDMSAHMESPSFGASQYEQPRLRKGSTASGQLSVGSSLNLEASSPFLRDDDRRSSRSSRFFAKVRKSMPFLKARRSQIMDEVPPFEQSNTTVGNRNNRVSFFQAPFRRFSAAPSALSLNNPQAGRVHSYYPPSQPPPTRLHTQPHPMQMPQQQPHSQNHNHQRNHGSRPVTANAEQRPSATAGQRPSTSAGPHHRYTDFGPSHQHPGSRLAVEDGAERHRKSEPPRDLPFDDNGISNPLPNRRAPRPLSVVSNRQVTPLRLHPVQSYQGNQTGAPFTQHKAGVPLPAALTSRGSAPNGVGSGHIPNSGSNSNGNKAGGVRGIFNLRCSMLGPLAEIHLKIERALKSRAIVLRKMTEVLYSCEDRGLRFEILVEHVQGHLHFIKFKRLEGSWWAYKKLTVAVADDLQSSEFMTR
ncbi:hypothetical protein GGI04_003265 [Coemansia thaxteri]|uniref:non-specific serine/threonine protein kinase n=1 Tax=Coemansia thaxteri TaxID=2663907 RepID=A0A9W8BBN5_9FUNG|nr:hypothetical protein H4R26_004149 [Coemansia thaxteri]KAJ2002619.1 hypothetical protein GGI04_003265 [Coemansia thaxteri]KAJ2480536.1 hypothetical protein EV174_003697 [Coemansia sp. RSA 2320]